VAGSALGNAVGFGALTGGAVRYRVYGAAGVSAVQVARLTVLTGTSFALWLVLLGGLGLVFASPAIGAMLHLPVAMLHGGGLAVLAGGAMLVAWCRSDRAPLMFMGAEWPAGSALVVKTWPQHSHGLIGRSG
jgi:phosphatidylglycerol lysyltransferase